MTSENEMYGPGWKTCVDCGVTQPGVEPWLSPKSGLVAQRCGDTERCERYRRTGSFSPQTSAEFRFDAEDEP